MANFDEIAHLFAVEVVNVAEAKVEREIVRFRPRIDPFDLDDVVFIRIIRLSKILVRRLINILRDYIICGSRKSALDVKTKVLITLRFLASGSYQMDTACSIFTAVSQSSVSRAIHDVVSALNNQAVFNEWVKFPRNILELEHIRNEFYQKFQFPGVVGCIDCTHVAIFPPRINDPEYPEALYVNRKQYHSINVQLICDSNLKIINVNAKYPGSTHDAYIWRNSQVQDIFMNLHRRGNNSFYLLGDSGYPLRPWLITPIREETLPGTPEAAFNAAHKRTRCLIERCNGVPKIRFRCLLKHRVLHYNPITSSKIINACVVLHNMCIEHNIPMPPMDEENEVDYGMLNHGEQYINHGRVDPDLMEGRRLRDRIIRNYFN